MLLIVLLSAEKSEDMMAFLISYLFASEPANMSFMFQRFS